MSFTLISCGTEPFHTESRHLVFSHDIRDGEGDTAGTSAHWNAGSLKHDLFRECAVSPISVVHSRRCYPLSAVIMRSCGLTESLSSSDGRPEAEQSSFSLHAAVGSTTLCQAHRRPRVGCSKDSTTRMIQITKEVGPCTGQLQLRKLLTKYAGYFSLRPMRLSTLRMGQRLPPAPLSNSSVDRASLLKPSALPISNCQRSVQWSVC